MAELLDRIDHAVAGRCPCGAEPEPGSAYCSEDCHPTHIGPDTDALRDGGPHAARWRPDLVDDFDATGLQLVTFRPVREFFQRTYRRAGSDVWWFRLDDGHRFAGVDVAPEVARDRDARQAVWRRLERELTDPRRLDPTPFVAGRLAAPYIRFSVDSSRALEQISQAVSATVAAFGGLPQETQDALRRMAGEEAEGRQREALCAWLRANGIDPDWIPEDASIECDGQTIRCEMIVGRGYDDRPVRTWVSVRMTVPPAPEAAVSFEGWEAP